MSLVRFVEKKDQASWDFKEIIAEIEAGAVKHGQVRRIRMDNGGELIYEEIKNWFKERGDLTGIFSAIFSGVER